MAQGYKMKPTPLDNTLNAFVITVAVIVWLGISFFVGDALTTTAKTALKAEEQTQAWREGR